MNREWFRGAGRCFNKSLVCVFFLSFLALQGCGSSDDDENTYRFTPPDPEQNYRGAYSGARLNETNLYDFVKYAAPFDVGGDSAVGASPNPVDISRHVPSFSAAAPEQLIRYMQSSGKRISFREVSSPVSMRSMEEGSEEVPGTEWKKPITDREDYKEECQVSGSATVDAYLIDQSIELVDMRFDACRSRDGYLDGRFVIIQWYYANRIEVHFYGLESIDGGERTMIDGSLLNYSSSGDNRLGQSCVGTVADVMEMNLFVSIEEDEFFLEDLTYRDYRCFGSVNRLDVVGRVYDGDSGYVEVRTPEPLSYSDTPSGGKNMNGEMTFESPFPSRASVRFSSYKVEHESGKERDISIVTSSLDGDGDGNEELSVTMLKDDYFSGAGEDIGDADGDGMPNGWETMVGFNKFNPIDAQGDRDGDGFTNLEEFLYQGGVKDSDVHPVLFDAGVSVSLPFHVLETEREYELHFDVRNEGANTPSRDQFSLVIESSSVVDWRYLRRCSQESSQSLRIVCPFYSSRLVFVPREEGRIDFSVVMVYNGMIGKDISPGNDRSDISVDVFDQVVDVELTTSIGDIEGVVVGESNSRLFKLSNRSKRAASARVVVDYSDVVRPVYARYRARDYSYVPCVMDNVVVCEFSYIPAWGGFSIDIGFEGVKEGMGYVNVSVTPDIPDEDESNNLMRLEYYVGQSLEPYISDAWESGDGATLSLPEGIYVGGTGYYTRVLHIEGAGRERTYLVPRGSVGSLHLAQGGSISGVGIIGGRVDIRGNTVLKDNLFRGRVSINIGGGLTSWDPEEGPFETVVSGNIFDMRDVLGAGSSQCGGIWITPHDRLVMENNIVIGERDGLCSTTSKVSVSSRPGDTPWSVSIANNTFVSGVDALYVDLSSLSKHANVDVFNNIIHGYENGIVLRLGRGDVRSSFPFVRYNLMYEVENPLMYISSFDGTRKAAALSNSNLLAEPRFVDAKSLDFRLRADSSAVDGGTWIGAPGFDLEGTPRSMDGDGDGVAAPDIGAYEFHP